MYPFISVVSGLSNFYTHYLHVHGQVLVETLYHTSEFIHLGAISVGSNPDVITSRAYDKNLRYPQQNVRLSTILT